MEVMFVNMDYSLLHFPVVTHLKELMVLLIVIVVSNYTCTISISKVCEQNNQFRLLKCQFVPCTMTY